MTEYIETKLKPTKEMLKTEEDFKNKDLFTELECKKCKNLTLNKLGK